MEVCKTGRTREWKYARLEEHETGSMQDWKNTRMEVCKTGRTREWKYKNGRTREG